MSTVAVLGAGAGGLSAVVELTQAGHDVLLWNRNPATLAQVQVTGRVTHTGVLGTGSVRPALVTTDLADVVARAHVLVVCLPSIAHGALFADLAALGVAQPIVLNPGHTGAALHARQVWQRAEAPLPAVAELSTLTYVARVVGGEVSITGRAGTVRVASLPHGEAAVEHAVRLFPGVTPVSDVLASSLSNVNLVLHPPGAMLGLAWVEARGGDFTFYRDAMTPGVTAVLQSLDDERRMVAAAYGHQLPPLLDEMTAIGTIEPGWEGADIGAAIRAGEANSRIKAPDSTAHRYYREDLPFALLPLTELATIAARPVPTAGALLALGRAVLGHAAFADGLDRRRLGLTGLDLDGVRAVVTTTP